MITAVPLRSEDLKITSYLSESSITFNTFRHFRVSVSSRIKYFLILFSKVLNSA